MKNLKLLFCFLIVLSLASCSEELIEDKPLSTVSIDLREMHEDICFMTYNTFLLDVPNSFGGPQCEGPGCIQDALAICTQIAEQMPDVVHLQEVFVDEAAEILQECLEGQGYNVQFDDTNNQSFIGTGLGSGLMTASLLPMSNTQVVEFDNTTSIFNSGNDGAADKGFMINQIQLEPGCFITSINTHTDAGSDPASRCTRMLQFLQINEFIESAPGDIPMLLGGDFNLDANGGEELVISELIQSLNSMGGIFGSFLSKIIGGNCAELFEHPEFQESYIGALEFGVLTQLVKGEPVHLISGDQLDPTASDGQVLDYFILSNMSDAITNLEIETLEPDCELTWIVDRFEFNPETGTDDLVSSTIYYSEEEALEAQEECNLSGFQFCSVWSIEVCDNPSDHEPVITCLDYNCMDQLTNNPNPDDGGSDGPPIFECKPPCDPGEEECINGRCVPI